MKYVKMLFPMQVGHTSPLHLRLSSSGQARAAVIDGAAKARKKEDVASPKKAAVRTRVSCLNGMRNAAILYNLFHSFRDERNRF